MTSIKKYFGFVFLIFFCVSLKQKPHSSIGLIAYYPFNGSYNDISGNFNNPKLTNASYTKDRLGRNNRAIHFNGINEFLEVPNSSSLEIKNNFTLSVWVKVDGFYSGKCHGNSILVKGDDVGENTFYLRFDDHSILNNNNCYVNEVKTDKQLFYGNFVGSNFKERAFIEPGIWYLVTQTYDGIYNTLYVNGEIADQNKNDKINVSNKENLLIGKSSHSQYPYWFSGSLDELRIYDYALAKSEIASLLNSKR